MLQSELEELIEQAAKEDWEELDLAGKDIEILPAGIGKCKSLKKLILVNLASTNKLTSLPIEICELKNLQFLDLSYNNLSELPESITKLSSLRSLKLSYNSLINISDSITRLFHLRFLDLSSNRLREIPSSINRLVNLQSLDLSSNRLREIPDSINRLLHLRYLKLSYNIFSDIPDSINRLLNLQYLDLNSNRIIKIPDSIASLSNLRSLDLNSNRIIEIPDSITSLFNLQSLNLSKNHIIEIPSSITSLLNLQLLNLSHNNLSEVPQEIGKLPSLSYLNLQGNPITNPPLEIAQKDIKAIREYFKQLEQEGVDYLYEAKLLIIGESGAGKTSLANKIINPNYTLCEEDSTKGIEVLHWSFPLDDSNNFTVNIWDFGGQEIYHATHQYFLTKRSLYVLVVDTRKEDTDFYYWLNVVELLSDNSPILIVKNEKQDRQREINSNLRSEFRNLKDDIATNFADNRNLEAILTACKYHLNQLPHIGQTLPKTWVKVRHTLESDPRNFITLETYLQICKDSGFKERKNALQLSDYLHDLGICLHFQDDDTSSLYKIVILKPKWGTDAAYAVLDNKEVIRNFGRFTQQELAQVWSNAKYAGMYSELLELMKKFQLCYEIPQAKGSYIAPQLLTEKQPTYFWDDADNILLRYTYDFMPKGMILQFIVTMHEQIEKDPENRQIVWRSGVIINKIEYGNTRAEVIENYSKREIKIRVSGKNKRDLLTIVTYELDKIHNSYKRLANKYQKLIPCNCSICKGEQSPHFFEFANLKRRYEKGVPTVQCEKSYDHVEVLSLIDDIGERSILYARVEDEDKQSNRQRSKSASVSIYVN